jgi:ATP/maltotriose-dependent transcriptional regulator MalT
MRSMHDPAATNPPNSPRVRLPERPRLVERLGEAAAYPIVMVIAPAGYGKSTAVTEYLETLDYYVRLDLADGRCAPAELARRLDDAAGEDYHGTVAVDGLESVQQDPTIAKHLVDLIERTKSRVTWILASRGTVGLPIGTWLAYGDCEIIVGGADLRFTRDEAERLTRYFGYDAETELDDLLKLTEGWPAALHIGLRSASHSPEAGKLQAAVRDASQRLWAEQVYPELSEGERELLSVAALLPEIDVEVLGLAGFTDPMRILDGFRQRTSLLEETSSGIFRCFPLFQEFLRRQIESLELSEQSAKFMRAGRALETVGKFGAALDAYVAARSKSATLRMLESCGFDLLERGCGDVVVRALDALGEETKQVNSRILALRGVMQSLAGNPARAEALLRRALSRANGDRHLLASASTKLALLLTNRGGDILSLLLPIAEDATQTAANRAEAWSLLAAQQALAGQLESAKRAMGRVECLLIDVEPESARAKVLQRVGVAAMYAGEPDRARNALSQAAGLATELKLHSLASRAYANLSNLMLHRFDDVGWQLWYAERASLAAAKAQDPFDIETAALQLLDAELRYGRTERSFALEEQIAGARTEDQSRIHYLIPARALRLAWDGRFSEAHNLLVPSWSRLHHDFDRAVSGAQCALYLALDGKRNASVSLTIQTLELIARIDANGPFAMRSAAMGQLCCAVSEAVNGRVAHADRIMRTISSSAADAVVSLVIPLGEELIALVRRRSRRGSESFAAMLERLQPLGYAHMSLLLYRVWTVLEERKPEVKASRLTPTENDVLRLLAEGLSPKEIAVRRGCSISTVRTHTARSIAKLSCNGRGEAIALSRRMGILD